MSAHVDPAWGDDWMALADAVGATAPPHPEVDASFVPHPSHAHEFTNLSLELLLNRWAEEFADEPIPYWPADLDGYDPERRGDWK